MNVYFRTLLLTTVSLVSMNAFAASQDLTVTTSGASVYAESNDSSQVLMNAKQGQRFRTEGTRENGYVRLVTKSGRPLWIRESDVQAAGYSAADDIAPAQMRAQKGTAESPSFKRFSIDIGGSSNFSGTSGAYEANLGINFFILEWLVFRNAPFYRMQTGLSAQYGLDSSLQGRYSVQVIEGVTPNVQLGAGYRLINSGTSAPFFEGGAGINVKGLQVGATAKLLLNSAVANGASNEVLYSVNFSGSTGLF
jgi:hypothetical protein